LSDKVKFIDYVENEDMPSLYQMSELLIWPSLYEGFGIPIIESLFSGVPVLTSNLGVFREAAGKEAFM
jgi:glycosyltransferase involved in cell wall biosynthesis